MSGGGGAAYKAVAAGSGRHGRHARGKLAVLGGSGSGKSGRGRAGGRPRLGGRCDGAPHSAVCFLLAALAVRFLTRRFIGEYASNAGERRGLLGERGEGGRSATFREGLSFS